MSTIVREEAPPAPRVTPRRGPSHRGTEMLLLLMATIWGINYISVKFATEQMPPLAFNGARIGIASVVLMIVAFAVRGAWPDRRTTIALLLLGALGNGLYQVLFIEGIARTQAGVAALVLASSPAVIAIMSRVSGVERITRRRIAGIAASLAGIALVVFGSARASTHAPATMTGNLLVLSACVCWSLYAVLTKSYTERIDPVRLSAITMAGGAVPLLTVSGASIARVPWAAMPAMTWAALLYSSLIALVVGYFLWYRGVKVIGPTRTALYSNVQPVIALIAAWPMLGEVPTAVQIVGAIAIMAGVLLTRS